MKQIKRLVNVIKLRDMTGEGAIKREMALICIKINPDTRTQVKNMVKGYEGKIMDHGREHIIIEVTGHENVIDELLSKLEPFGIKKMARSGLLALYKES